MICLVRKCTIIEASDQDTCLFYDAWRYLSLSRRGAVLLQRPAACSAIELLSGGAAEGLSAYETCKDTCYGCEHRKQDLNKSLIHVRTEEGHTNGSNVSGNTQQAKFRERLPSTHSGE